MAKERSFWDWLFGSSCCSDRGKNYARKEDESKNKTGEVSKVSKSLQEEIENEPGSIFAEVPLDENSEYNSYLIGEGESDGSVEIR